MPEPHITERLEQPYASIKAGVTMRQIGEIAPPFIDEVAQWLEGRGIAPMGAPFFKYNAIDMEGEGSLELEVGWPVAEPVASDDRVLAGVLPAGRYATVTHVGPPSTLASATGSLLEWAEKEGLKFDVSESDAGDCWAARLEVYLIGPEDTPDMNLWETELAFKLA